MPELSGEKEDLQNTFNFVSSSTNWNKIKEADWEGPSMHGKHKNSWYSGSFPEAEKNMTLKRGDRLIETEAILS